MNLEGKEAGQVAPVLLLAFALGIEIVRFVANYRFLQSWQQHYQTLNQQTQQLQRETPAYFRAWGQDWYELAPRIDYGAYTKRSEEAEALCYFLWSVPYSGGGPAYRCE